MVLGVQCKASSAPSRERPDLSIAAALDRSASMMGSKLAALKTATRELVERLGPRDRLVLVAFDGTAEVLAAGPVVDRRDFLAEIDRLECRSGTNIALGLETAGRFLEDDGTDHSRVKRLLLLTDGEASKGETSAPGLAKISARLAGSEVVTTCLGFGLEYDEKTLDAIATAGAGRLHHVSDPAKLPAIYGAELDRMRALVAPWIRISVTPFENARVHGSRNTYPMKRKERGFELEVSDLRTDEARWVLFDLHVPAVEASQDVVKLADVVVHWKDVSGETHEVKKEVVVRFADDATAKRAEPNGEVLVQMALLDVAAAKARALVDAQEGNITEGTFRLRNSLLKIAGTTSFKPPRLAEELAKLEVLGEKLEKNAIDTGVRKAVQAEIHEGRTPTFRLDLGDAPPL